MDAAVFESKSRSGREITNHLRHDSFARAGRSGNSCRYMSCKAANLPTVQVDLADMDAATQ